MPHRYREILKRMCLISLETRRTRTRHDLIQEFKIFKNIEKLDTSSLQKRFKHSSSLTAKFTTTTTK